MIEPVHSIHKWHILIGGFTQNLGKANGFDKLWMKMRTHVSSLVTLIPPQKWDANFSDLASFIERMKPEDIQPDIRVYAYSWGCGHGFLKLANELKRRGHRITSAVLCDPVFHSWWRPHRALFTGKWALPLNIPENVGQVFWFRQFQNRPQGTELRPLSVYTTVHNAVVLKAEHAWMDNQREFHDRCLYVASL